MQMKSDEKLKLTYQLTNLLQIDPNILIHDPIDKDPDRLIPLSEFIKLVPYRQLSTVQLAVQHLI